MLALIGGRYKYAFDALVIALLVAGAAWGVHAYNTHQQDIGAARVQAQWDKQIAADAAAAHAKEIQLQQEKDNAIKQAAQQRQVTDAAIASAATSSRVLHDALQSIGAGAAGATLAAAREHTATLAAVLDQCQRAYGGLAKEADGHAGDSLMLQQAWPK